MPSAVQSAACRPRQSAQYPPPRDRGIDPPVVDLRWAVARAAPRPSSYRGARDGAAGRSASAAGGLPVRGRTDPGGRLRRGGYPTTTGPPGGGHRREPRAADGAAVPALEIIGVGGLVLVVVAGIAGVDNPSRNLAPVLVNVLFWLGLPLAEIVFGDLYASLNPWRALAQWTGLGERRPGPKWSASAFGRLPSGTWSLCGYRWCLRSGAWRRPSGGGGRTHRCAARVGCGRRPRESPSDRRPLYHLQRDGRGHLTARQGRERRAKEGVARPADTHGIATGSWRIRRGDDRSGVVGWVLLHPVVVGDDGQRRRLSRTWDAGVVDHVGSCVGGAIPRIRLCRPQRVPSLDDDQGLCPGAGAIGPGGDARPPPPVLLFEGQLLLSTISDPLGVGWDLFGTADHKIAFFATPATLWWFQAAGFVSGGIASLVVVHRRMALLDPRGDTVRREYGMLLLMVTLTLAVMTVTALRDLPIAGGPAPSGWLGRDPHVRPAGAGDIWLLRRAERRARADAARREQEQEEPSNSTNGDRP